MIRGIFFDWGGVLCVDPTAGFLRYCSDELGIELSLLTPAIRRHLPVFMQGLPESEFWRHVGMELNKNSHWVQGSLWGRALAAVYEPLSDTLQYSQELALQGFKVGVLSNTEPPSRDFHLGQNYHWFCTRIFSCDHALSKPDPRIYTLAAQKMDLPIADCLLVDDRMENIQGALQTGMQAIHFQDLATFRTQLQKALSI